jgi:hypothetical protein
MGDMKEEFKNYAINNIDTINREYEWQLSKWRRYHRLVADAHSKAYKDFTTALNNIRQQQDAEEAATREFGMFAITLIATPVLSWISGAIQYKLYPRAVALRNPDFIRNNVINKSWDAFTKAAEKSDYSKVAAKVFGDTISKATGHALDSIFSKLMPEPEKGRRDPDFRFQSTTANADFTTYRTNLENALDTEVGRVTKQLAIWKKSVSGSYEFGGDILKEVEKRLPGPRVTEKQKWDEGKRQIDTYCDILRSLYAADWAFYRNNPVQLRIDFFPEHIEAEIWALWILGSEWKSKYVGTTSDYPDVASYWFTSDGYELGRVTEALADFAGQEFGLMRSEIGKVDPAVLNAEIDPAIKLSDAVQRRRDDDIQMQKLLDWAKSNPGQLLNGSLDYRPRNLGTIANVESIFADE